VAVDAWSPQSYAAVLASMPAVRELTLDLHFSGALSVFLEAALC
jgi:hypothetical protein